MWLRFALVLAIILPFAGCRVCDSPYDYTGPVVPCGDACGGCHDGNCGGGGCATCQHGGDYHDGGMHGSNVVEGEIIYEQGTTVPGELREVPQNPQPLTPPSRPTPAPVGPMARRSSMDTAIYETPAPGMAKSRPTTRPAGYRGSGGQASNGMPMLQQMGRSLPGSGNKQSAKSGWEW
ncbi:MAG: hypothetical protein SFX18_00705 [Pirellulales bacterium]|nr:hypothetical protein [Pirellulales bacterium]